MDGDVVVANGHRPAGVVEGDRPCPPIALVDVGDLVRVSAVVDDDVTRSYLVGRDLGHHPRCG